LMDKNIVCYKCNYLGHKARDCRYMNEDVPMPTTVWRRKEIPNNEGNKYARNMNGVNRRYGNNHVFFNRSYNSFYPLMDKNIVCYKCNYLGHKARDC